MPVRNRAECSATVRDTSKAAPGSRRSRTVFTADSMPRRQGRTPLFATSGPWTDLQMAAALATGLPGFRGECEPGGLERAVVHAAGDPAQRGDVPLGQPGLAPGVLQRTAHQRDVQAAGVAAGDVRGEHATLVRHAGHERVAESGEVRGREARELPPDLRPAPVD